MSARSGKFAALGLAAALFATAAVAQPASPPSAPAAAPSARQIELAHRYMQAINMDKTMAGMMKNMLPAMLAKMPMNPNVTDAQRQAITEVTTEVTTEMMHKLFAGMEPIMAETFSEQELADLVAFYESPTGRAVMAKTPQMMARLAPLMADLMPAMQAEMRTKLCAKIDCSGAASPAPPKS